MPEQKYEKFFLTIRPQCGLLPSELEDLSTLVHSLNCNYYNATEMAASAEQATHVHILMHFPLPRKKSHIKRVLWKAFSARVKDSMVLGVQFKTVPDSGWEYHLGYCQKEGCETNSYRGFTDKQLRIGYARYLEEAKKCLKGKTIGSIPLTKKNLFAYIRDYRNRNLIYCPIMCLKQMLQTDRYIAAFASLSQQCAVERYLATGRDLPMSLITHVIGDCHHQCPNCTYDNHSVPLMVSESALDTGTVPSYVPQTIAADAPHSGIEPDVKMTPIVEADVPFPTVENGVSTLEETPSKTPPEVEDEKCMMDRLKF